MADNDVEDDLKADCLIKIFDNADDFRVNNLSSSTNFSFVLFGLSEGIHIFTTICSDANSNYSLYNILDK